MKKYAILYHRRPTNYHDKKVAIVEAESPEAALELLMHALGDHSGVRNHSYGVPKEYVPPQSQGRVITLDNKNCK
jgi:hypothetical protein